MMRRGVTLLAIVLALAGTATAAGRLLTGAGIQDGSLTGADFRDHGLGSGDLGFTGPRGLTGPAGVTGPPGPVGARGPGAAGPAYAFSVVSGTISGSGALTEGKLGGRTVITHPITGVYCFEELYVGFLQLVGTEPGGSTIVAYTKDDLAPCPGSTTSFKVTTFNDSGALVDRAFHLVGS